MQSRFTPLATALALSFVHQAYAAGELPSVVVTATRQDTRVSQVLSDVTVITSEEIQRAGPSTSIVQLLGRQPGIEFSQSGGIGTLSNVFIRGSNSNHVLLLVDGLRVGSASLGTPAWEYLPLEQIDRIEIVRGPASSLYGSDAIGGVIQIFTRSGQGPFQPFFEAGYGSYKTSALSAGFLGAQNGWKYNFQLSDKHSSDGISAIRNPANFSYNPDKDGYQIASSSGGLSYSPAQGHEFGVNYLYSDGWNRYDAGGFGTPAADDYKQKETLYSVNVFSRNQLAGIWTSTVRIGQSSDDGRLLDNGVRTSLIHSTQTQYQWQNDIKIPMGKVLAGIERVEQHLVSDADYVKRDRSIDSLFAGWSGYLGNHTVQVNGRQDHNSQFGDRGTGSVGYGYRFARDWQGSVSMGTAYKAPTFNDLYYPADAFGDVSNPNLEPETSVNREASLRYETAQHKASVTYYRNEVKNLIQWAPIDPTFTTTFGYTPSNVASATLSGWTLAYAGDVQGFKLSASLDFQDPRDDVLDKTLTYRARRIAKFAVSRDVGPLNIGAELQATGERYADQANAVKLAGYGLVNLSASYRVADGWSVFARANNVFDRQYTLIRDYATPGANVFVGVRYALK